MTTKTTQDPPTARLGTMARRVGKNVAGFVVASSLVGSPWPAWWIDEIARMERNMLLQRRPPQPRPARFSWVRRELAAWAARQRWAGKV